MQTQKVSTLRDVPQLDVSGFVKASSGLVAVLAVHANSSDIDAMLADPDGYVNIVNMNFGERDVLSHRTFASNKEMFVVVLPKQRRERHYLPTFFRVEPAVNETSRQFRLTRMVAVPHDIQPAKVNAVTWPISTKWEESLGLVPMGHAMPYSGFSWKADLAQVALETLAHGYIDFKLNQTFVMLDDRREPEADWPNFFSVADGGHGMSSTFRPLPMQLVPATDVLTAYIPHKEFDGW